MATFAIISEGKTDQVIIDRLIHQTCGAFFDKIAVRYARPMRDATDAKTATHGNWELVLEYCQHGISDALETNDFVVIQIDTDCGDHKNFGVQLTECGVERDWSQLVKSAEAIISAKIGQEILTANLERFIFAIAVHSSEAWLLTYFFGEKKTKNCFSHLSSKIIRNGTLKKFSKDVRSYTALAAKIKSRDLATFEDNDDSFGHLLRQLKRLRP